MTDEPPDQCLEVISPKVSLADRVTGRDFIDIKDHKSLSLIRFGYRISMVFEVSRG